MIRFGKKVSIFTAIALSVTIGMSACENIDSNSVPTVSETTTSISLTQMTTTTTVPEILTTTTTEATTTTTTTPTETTTTASESETTASETTTGVSSSGETETTAVTSTSGKWTETIVNKTMYTTQACYSRREAIIGAEIVGEYAAGTEVKVVAVTNTGYYKLEDGTFIHSDYLTETGGGAPAVTTAAATTAVTNAPSANVSITSNVPYTERYYWNQLSSAEQDLYAKLVTAAENFDTRTIEASNLDYATKQKVFFLVFNMEPQLFWIDTGADVTPYGIGLNYIATQDEAAIMQQEIDNTTAGIMRQASQYNNVFNKLLVFYNYIVLNNDFLLSGTAATCGIENGLRPGTEGIQCNGYAKTMQYLCDIAGIECLTIPGMNAHDSTHAWNKIEIAGKWYNMDATWGDPADMGGSYICHPFFLVPDAWITESHLMPNTKTLNSGSVINFFDAPACTSDDLNYFRLMNREYTGVEAGYAGICADIKRALEAGEQTAEVRITDAASYNTLISNSYWKAAQDYARTIKPGVTLSLQKSDRAGTQILQYKFK
ncbi:MAG: hypothetical protein LBL80_05735 [Ruminococcus sp.]|nr:hypothetical protein [Ruminococcus sp.]